MVNVDIVLMEVLKTPPAMSLGHTMFITVNQARLSLLKTFHSIALFCNSKKTFFGMNAISAKAEKVYRGTGNWKG